MNSRRKPDIIQEVGFDFSWDERKVWALNVPTEKIGIAELVWHLDVPFLWSQPDGYYDIKPRSVLEAPQRYPEEYARVCDADTSYPIDIMLWRGRWVILDGLHRLMKLVMHHATQVDVRRIPKKDITKIQK